MLRSVSPSSRIRAVPARIRRVLNVESGLNDGIATPFVFLALTLAAARARSVGWLATPSPKRHRGRRRRRLGLLGGRLLRLADAGDGRRRCHASCSCSPWPERAISSRLRRRQRLYRGIHRRPGVWPWVAQREEARSASRRRKGRCWPLVSGRLRPRRRGRATDLAVDTRAIVYAILSLTVIRMLPVAIAMLARDSSP